MDRSTADAAPAPVAPTSRHGRRRSRRRRWPVVVAVLALAAVVVGVWMGLRALQAATSLYAVAQEVRGVQADVRAGRTEAVQESVADIRRHADRADRATSDPVWWLAERLPVVGVDAVAVRTVADAMDELATAALTPLADVAPTLAPRSLRPVDGRIDLAPFAAAAPTLQAAAEVTGRVHGRVSGLDAEALHAPLAGAVRDLGDGLGAAADALDTAARLAALLPPMLGAEGPRSYLLLFLHSGELRVQGGIVGAMAVVTAEDGRLTLTDQAANSDLPRYREPVLPLAPEELAVATDELGRYMQNTVMLPETPRAAALAAEMWRRAGGLSVDGVVLVDPVALSYVLAVTGDVPHPDGTVLTASTLVPTLLVDAYAGETALAESDAFFAAAASATFSALAAGAGDPAALVDALSRAAAERRLSVWSAHPEEQAQILGTRLDGALLTGGHEAAVGLFLDNASGWKTDSFLRTEVSLESARCEGGTTTTELALTLTSTLPQDAGTLPYYVVGDGSTGVPVGSMRLRVSVYTPVGGTVDGIRRGEAFLGAPGTVLAGREVRLLTQTLGPGETVTLRFTVTAPARGPEVPLWTTPTTTSPGFGTLSTGCPDG